MKRHLLISGICLLLGAVVNVAVAWAFVERSDLENVRWALATPEQQEFWERQQEAWENHPSRNGRIGVVSASLTIKKGFGITQRVVGCRRSFFPEIHHLWAQYGAWGRVRAGWPLRSLHGEAIEVRDEWVRRGVIPSPWSPVPWMDHTDGWRDLPFRPIWPGFAVNTLSYASILWLLVPGPFALRPLLRRWRGLCVACGYDLRYAQHTACPECGASSPAIALRHRR